MSQRSVILVVDDDPMMLALERMVLEQIGGYDVISTQDPAEAIDLASSQHASAIVLDVSLGPNQNGIDLSKKIKNDERSKSVPILLATAHGEADKGKEILFQSGADAYIAKPFSSLQDLVGKVRALLARRLAEVSV
ncbi:MAG TPA: response regulator [Bdellovibrionota bacterium]|nr:response regulator [Bdellovibrionota bacterium]